MSRIKAAMVAMTILMFPLLGEAARHRPVVAAAPSGSIAGTVTSNGSPVAGAAVTVWRDGKQVASVAVTGDHFTFSGPDGTYEVQASAPHYRPEIAVRVTVVVHSGRETWVNLVLVAAS